MTIKAIMTGATGMVGEGVLAACLEVKDIVELANTPRGA
ncbi:MAG: hypothetical protein QOG38_48 [Hyphomicrobiales bacterium]|nr:hypothetical protein [Hyphomicrobiales bacterium]